jgi:heme oxygenase
MAITLEEKPDLSLPMSSLIRQMTTADHERVSNSEGAVRLLRGELNKDEYIRYLAMLWHIYECVHTIRFSVPSAQGRRPASSNSTLENALERHASHPVLMPTHNPPLLSRTASLLEDMSHLLGIPVSQVKSHPTFAAVSRSPPEALAVYLARLRSLDGSPDPAPLLAHAYVRYMGDLSGGQIIRRRVTRAYRLEDEDGAGVSYYRFQKLGGAGGGGGGGGSAGLGDIQRIKEWYRDGMDAGVGDDDQDQKGQLAVTPYSNSRYRLPRAELGPIAFFFFFAVAILVEARKAFELNSGLLELFKAPSGGLDLPTSSSTASVHHHQVDPAVSLALDFLGDSPKAPTEIPRSPSLWRSSEQFFSSIMGSISH